MTINTSYVIHYAAFTLKSKPRAARVLRLYVVIERKIYMSGNLFFWALIAGLVFFALSALFGGDGVDVHADTDSADVEHEGAAVASQVITVRNFFLFMVGFGAAGLVAQSFGYDAFRASGFGIAGGIVLGILGFLFFRMLKRSQGNSMAYPQKLAGRKGTVTLAIPEGGAGEISMSNEFGTRISMMARSQEGSIAEGSAIEVVTVTGSSATVKKLQHA